MKKSRRITLLFAIFLVVYVLVFIQSIYAKKTAFQKGKADILVSAGYSVTSDAIVWRENGRYSINGIRCTDYKIMSDIDSLIKTNEDYEMIHVLMISIGLLGLLIYLYMYNYDKSLEEHNEFLEKKVLTQEHELDAIKKSSTMFYEQEEIRKKRLSVEIYDYETDKAHPLDTEKSEEYLSDKNQSEENDSEE